MKRLFSLIFISILSLFFIQCRSGLVTMTNACYNGIEQGNAANKAGNYTSALDLFNQVLQKCDAYDAKEKGYAGKAAALNGLQQYNEALAAATEGLKISSTSIDNLFAKATAEIGLGRSTDAKADLNTIVNLTQKNRNVTQRATIYAKMAEIDLEAKMYSDAVNNISTAISMDASNANFYMLRGDINAAQENFTEAIQDYDMAITKGKDDGEAWQARTTAVIKSYQKKYDTVNAQELASKISSEDKKSLCSEIRKTQGKGVKDVNIDLLRVSVCK